MAYLTSDEWYEVNSIENTISRVVRVVPELKISDHYLSINRADPVTRVVALDYLITSLIPVLKLHASGESVNEEDWYIGLPLSDDELRKWAVVSKDRAISDSDEYGQSIINRMSELDSLLFKLRASKANKEGSHGEGHNDQADPESRGDLSQSADHVTEKSLNDDKGRTSHRGVPSIESNGFAIYYSGNGSTTESSLIRELLKESESQIAHDPTPLNPGLHILMGKAGIGKSKVISDLAASCDKQKWRTSIIRAAEPDFRAQGGLNDIVSFLTNTFVPERSYGSVFRKYAHIGLKAKFMLYGQHPMFQNVIQIINKQFLRSFGRSFSSLVEKWISEGSDPTLSYSDALLLDRPERLYYLLDPSDINPDLLEDIQTKFPLDEVRPFINKYCPDSKGEF